MADPELVKILRQGSEVWNRWREQQPPNQIFDFSGTNFCNAHLRGADLHRVILRHASLNHADLSKANLTKADCTNATLCDTSLLDAYLSGANFYSANLQNADLRYATLSNVNITRTNLTGVILFETVFTNIDFRETRGLTEIRHQGPSSITLQNIQLPSNAASQFLRGCGVPDEWINLYLSQITHPTQYYSCFISYSSKDDILAHRLHADLQARGVRCWFAPEDMKIGNKIRDRVDEAIHLQDKLLLLLSEHSIASAWVEDEVEAALEKERRQQRGVLFPIRIDNAAMETSQVWAAKLRRQRHIGDFTNWTDPQAYEKAFERLLRDLKKADKQGREDGEH